ncbi:hypothetical protein M413DRAFT_26211 [Hebeloma cylindrosporum]|uniref:Uncharacterized protein n=1 Tax=Hebeloma cylindrosporum TaxID=76867 RepID=A0A0C3C226_HEBCY|nr:hypothetical protein M413DRAFT_26211 [Hebeloma cylindrosporum h7]
MSHVDPLRASLNSYFENSKSTNTSRPSHTIDVNAAQARSYSPYSNGTYSPSSTVYSSHTLVPPNDHARDLFESVPAEHGFTKKVESRPYAHPFTPINEELPIKNPQKTATTPMQRDYVAIPAATPLVVGPRLSSSKKLWADSFEMGSRIQDPNLSLQCASRIVHCGYEWNDDEIGDLVRAFVWNASTVLADGHDALAVFAQRVYRFFFQLSSDRKLGDISKRDPKLGDIFKRALHATVLGTFNASWSGGSQHRRISYELRPSESHIRRVSSALLLCNFIGALYRFRFLGRSDIQACIHILMNNMDVLEHLCAIRNILLHAGTRYWEDAGLTFDEEVRTLGAELIRCSKRLRLSHNKAILPHRELPFATVGEGVNTILEYIRECKNFVDNKALGTQKTLVRGRDV